MSNNIRRNLNAAIAAYANGIAIRRNMPSGHPRKAELNRELKKTLFHIKNLEANLAMRQAATVLLNMRKRINSGRAATKIQSAWRGHKSRQNARLRRGHSVQMPTIANRHYGRMARTRTLRANSN